MPNKDGFEPGQELTLAEIMQIQRKHAAKPEAPMGKAAIRAELEARGVEIPKGATVAEMREMLEGDE